MIGVIPFDDVEMAANAIHELSADRSEAMKLALEQIAHWISGRCTSPRQNMHAQTATGYSIDSRTLSPGDLFFAVRGERFDGHDFVVAALERGAGAAVVAKTKVLECRNRPVKILC